MATYREVLTFEVTTAGSAGSAVGTAAAQPVPTGLSGYITQVEAVYNGGAPATMDFSLIEIRGDDSEGTVATISDNNTNLRFTPSVELYDASGSGLGAYANYHATGSLRIDVAQSDALGTAITVYVKLV